MTSFALDFSGDPVPCDFPGSEDFDVLDDQDGWVVCPRCHGSGHTIEGLDCEYCDGTGEIEI
jgi:RecJ-like exonuclease